jgi:hypothetical protein
MTMTRAHENAGRPVPPALADLFTRYLRQQADAAAAGVGYAEPADEAVPHDAVPVQPVDPQLAWNDAVAAARHFPAGPAQAWAVPPEWPVLVAAQEPAVALAFCLGNFPQLVRNLRPLLSDEPAALRLGPMEPLSAPATLLDWAGRDHDYAQALLAAGALRLARHFDRAEELLRAEAPKGWEAVAANERAALAWHRGRHEAALDLWRAQPDSVPVLFNRGMAALFLGRPAEARAALSRAVAGLPETSAWHHLGHLYLALAASRAA